MFFKDPGERRAEVLDQGVPEVVVILQEILLEQLAPELAQLLRILLRDPEEVVNQHENELLVEIEELLEALHRQHTVAVGLVDPDGVLHVVQRHQDHFVERAL